MQDHSSSPPPPHLHQSGPGPTAPRPGHPDPVVPDAPGLWPRLRWALAGLIFIATLGLTLYYYPDLPDEIPTHFRADGTVNAWGPKSSFAFVPAIVQAITGIIIFLVHLMLARPAAPAGETKIFGVFTARQKPVSPGMKFMAGILVDGIMFLLFLMLLLVQRGIIAVALNPGAGMSMAPLLLGKLLIAWGFFWAVALAVKGIQEAASGADGR